MSPSRQDPLPEAALRLWQRVGVIGPPVARVAVLGGAPLT